jgi:hypothetical protein
MKTCVYMMVADAGEGWSYCKIGITCDLANRVKTVQVGCPVPITEVAYLYVPQHSARRVESTFHERLAAFHTQGEWFRLRLHDPEHKALFAEAHRRVAELFIPSGERWRQMDLAAVRAMCRALRLDKVA